MIKIAICDNDIYATTELEELIYKYEPQVEIEVCAFYDGERLLSDIGGGERFDILFLDIELSGINGIELVRQIRKIDNSILIVYVTENDEFAKQGYEVNAFRFLKNIFKSDKLTNDESMMLCLAKQSLLLTAELIKCIESGITNIENESELIDILYDDFSDGKDLSIEGRFSKERIPMLEALCNLYLKKLVILETTI